MPLVDVPEIEAAIRKFDELLALVRVPDNHDRERARADFRDECEKARELVGSYFVKIRLHDHWHPGWTFVIGPGLVAWREGWHEVSPLSDLKRFELVNVPPSE